MYWNRYPWTIGRYLVVNIANVPHEYVPLYLLTCADPHARSLAAVLHLPVGTGLSPFGRHITGRFVFLTTYLCTISWRLLRKSTKRSTSLSVPKISISWPPLDRIYTKTRFPFFNRTITTRWQEYRRSTMTTSHLESSRLELTQLRQQQDV